MSVKRYYWDRKSDCDCEIIEQPDGAMVDYDEHASVVAELEARCTALAAENAGLKSIQEWAVSGVFKSGAKVFESTKASGFDTDDCLHDAVLVMLSELKTPETDAFLAEVRAQGVDSAINTVIAMMNHQHPVTSKAIDILRVHSYQLRKGVQS
ncbi:TPA: hypothetical protein ACXDE7_000505 [Enterobacter roggenkampii]